MAGLGSDVSIIPFCERELVVAVTRAAEKQEGHMKYKIVDK